MSRLAMVCFVLATTACVTDESNGPGPGSGMTPSGAIVPRTGQWYYDDITKITSSCAGDDNGIHGSFLIEDATASGFRIIPGDGTDPFACSLNSGAFFCPDRAQLVEDLRPGIDAVLTGHATAEGTFATSLRGGGRQEATVTCAGSECAALGSWPCTIEVSFSVLAR